MKKLPIFLFLVASFTYAEVHKEVRGCLGSSQMCFYWWPKLPEIKGWKQDIRNSYHYRVNTQAPIGFTFSNAEAVIYANAEYREPEKDTRTMDEFVEFSQNQFIANAPSALDITKTEILTSQDGKSFLSYSFFPSAEGNWEQVSYSEDSDIDGNQYFVIVVLSATSKEAYEQNIDDYFQFISAY